MPDAIRKQMLEEMRDTLRSRLPELVEVEVLKLPSLNQPIKPSAALWISGETKREDQLEATFADLEVNVQVFAQGHGELELMASEWISKVVGALLLDKNRRGLAFDTVENGNATFVPDLTQPEYVVGFIFRVTYPHQIGRPDMSTG